MGGASHTSKKMEEIIGDFAERTCNKNVSFAHVFRLHFGIHGEFMPFFKRLYACGSSRVSFAIDCLGNMTDSFEPNLVEGMEEFYFGADQVSIPESDDSAGRAQYYVESYVYEYEPEEPLNDPGLGENSEATSAEDSTAQMPILPGCFITTSGTCVHSSCVLIYSKERNITRKNLKPNLLRQILARVGPYANAKTPTRQTQETTSNGNAPFWTKVG